MYPVSAVWNTDLILNYPAFLSTLWLYFRLFVVTCIGHILVHETAGDW